MVLRRVHARFRLDRPVGWVEGELVRRGAREAHAVAGGAVAIVLAAASRADAVRAARDLLSRLGAAEIHVA